MRRTLVRAADFFWQMTEPMHRFGRGEVDSDEMRFSEIAERLLATRLTIEQTHDIADLCELAYRIGKARG